MCNGKITRQIDLGFHYYECCNLTNFLANPEFFTKVAAVLINDHGEVLMMQEAKKTCAGQWYLPAGRMEPGEDIAEAAQREVLEETGLHFQVNTLLMVESAGKYFIK